MVPSVFITSIDSDAKKCLHINLQLSGGLYERKRKKNPPNIRKKKNIKRDHTEMQQPSTEKSRLGLTESIHKKLASCFSAWRE